MYRMQHAWPLVLLLPMMLVLHWGVVRREERYLEAMFGVAASELSRRRRPRSQAYASMPASGRSR